VQVDRYATDNHVAGATRIERGEDLLEWTHDWQYTVGSPGNPTSGFIIRRL
jgi:hypothetical protein